MLLVVLVALAMAGAITFAKMKEYRGDAQLLIIQLRQAEADLAHARDKIAEMNEDRRIMLANRIPGVAELRMNGQIQINDQYVRSITFTQANTGKERAIEFTVVLENSRTETTRPNISIVLFDEFGRQTGATQLTKELSITPINVAELQPRETRTYSGRIQLQLQTPSKYFVVDVN